MGCLFFFFAYHFHSSHHLFPIFFFAPDAYSLATKNIFRSWFLPKQKVWTAAVHWAWAGLGRKTLQLRRKKTE
jgi:hypothetical protein